MIPDHELDLFSNTVDEAVALASQGRIADGHAALIYGLERILASHEDGEEWAGELLLHFQEAIANYCEAYGVRMH